MPLVAGEILFIIGVLVIVGRPTFKSLADARWQHLPIEQFWI
jgi:hypothetical protein